MFLIGYKKRRRKVFHFWKRQKYKNHGIDPDILIPKMTIWDMYVTSCFILEICPFERRTYEICTLYLVSLPSWLAHQLQIMAEANVECNNNSWYYKYIGKRGNMCLQSLFLLACLLIKLLRNGVKQWIRYKILNKEEEHVLQIYWTKGNIWWGLLLLLFKCRGNNFKL